MITSIIATVPLIFLLVGIYFCQHVAYKLKENKSFSYDGFLKIGVWI